MVGPLHCILQIERQGDRTEKSGTTGYNPRVPHRNHLIKPIYNCLLDYLEITIARKACKIKGFQWSIRDSNPWPPQCECGALPAALIPQIM